jgi:DNA-binding response OmpR family regulator
MSKKVIVLADNSYTIRRIVELSFSEIEDVEVRSFESGAGIQDKLLQLAPAVVIVDVKLPEFSGYDVCRFVNETPSLKDCRVFLMKGSFEPVDNEMIRHLRYEDIVTKPFDSNALVDTVMKVVRREEPGAAAAFPGESPTTFPEDFPEIETEIPENEDISFSDVRGEMEVSVAQRPAAVPPPERDEILPSEEITQTQPAKDSLLPQEAEEPLRNPFDEEPAFEEINAAVPAAAQPATLEFAVEPTPGSRDVSDEFHERFMEIASEDLLKPAPTEPGVEKLALEFEQTDMGSPAQTMYAGPLAQDRLAPTRKAEAPAAAPAAPEKAPARERAADKPRTEMLSPQDELARLCGLAKREPRPEPAPRPATAEAQRFELTNKLEERLNQTIKELLWEIVPPLAEKIIKDEIDKIKSELNESGF